MVSMNRLNLIVAALLLCLFFGALFAGNAAGGRFLSKEYGEARLEQAETYEFEEGQTRNDQKMMLSSYRQTPAFSALLSGRLYREFRLYELLLIGIALLWAFCLIYRKLPASGGDGDPYNYAGRPMNFVTKNLK